MRHTAFTLIELIVTMGIIALLVAILMPALASASAAAWAVQCQANLKNIGAGWTLYVDQHPNKWPLAVSLPQPKSSAPPNELTIMQALGPYIHNNQIYHDPADDHHYFTQRGTSYEYLPGLAFAIDPSMMGWAVGIAKLTPAVVPILDDAARYHPAPPNLVNPKYTVYYDDHVDWLFNSLPVNFSR